MIRKNITIAVLALSLSGCGSDYYEKKHSVETGILAAQIASNEVHAAYLNCYALDAKPKKLCVSDLTKNHIDSKFHGNNSYVQAFQFEAEKLGFKSFLLKQNQPCKSINNGPKFIKDTDSYLAICTPDLKYFMRFDYDAKEWILG